MKIALSTIGKFHTFDLARELHAKGALAAIFTAYPHFKLKGEGLPRALIRSFPYVQAPYMGFPWLEEIGPVWRGRWRRLSAVSFGAYVARNLPPCDIYVGLSGSSLRAGHVAQKRGARYVCDRGSSHIRAQDTLLREEHELWGAPYEGVDPWAIETEEAEYAAADAITVPSSFVQRTFIARGVAPEKLKLLPYGVDLSRFEPVAAPAPGRFDLLFAGGMSLRKGVQYLVEAYRRVEHPAKSLTFAGDAPKEMIDLLRRRGLWPEEARVLGHVPQSELKRLMSASHAMALPSIEEGLALVQAQAMACGCPVVASTNTGAEDLFDDGREGFIVPIRSVDALTERLQFLADNPDARAQMGECALSRVKAIGGWRDYGDKALSIYRDLAAS